ncbi:MAG: hypothetical protein AB7V11_18075 [Pyrinomonadaceae bacterium]
MSKLLDRTKPRQPSKVDPKTGKRKTYEDIINEAVNGPTQEQKDRQSTDSNNY